MIGLHIGLYYNEFLEYANDEELHIINEFRERTSLREEGLERIKDIKDPVHILAFSETRCKDAASEIPFLMKLAELNDKITVRFLKREGNEALLERISGDARIPTFLVLNDKGEVIRKYIEFPIKLKNKLNECKVEDTQNIIDDMRLGKYDQFIQEDLISFITGIDYEFVEFKRKDQ